MGKRIDNTSCHCLKMRRSAENVIQFYDNTIAQAGLTARQYSLLKSIRANKGCNAKELADITLIERSTLARNLKPLLRGGYIVDKKDEGARDSILELTQKGEEAYRQSADLWQTAQEKIEAKLGKDKLELLEKLLESFQDL